MLIQISSRLFEDFRWKQDRWTPTQNDIAQWCLATDTYGLVTLELLVVRHQIVTSMLELADIEVGELLISEIMHSPSMVYDYRGEWFELYNPKEERLNIKGLLVTANDGDTFTIDDDVIVRLEGYVVIGSRRSPTDNGGIDNVPASYSVNDLD